MQNNQKFGHRFPSILKFCPVPPPGYLGQTLPHGMGEGWETMQEGIHHLA